MPEDLSCNRSGGVDLHDYMSHLKWRPVVMFDEVSYQFLTVRVILI